MQTGKIRAGYTALHFAASKGQVDTVNALLGAGANVAAVTKQGGSTLDMAINLVMAKQAGKGAPLALAPDVLDRHKATARALVARGADVNAPTCGSTLLCTAVWQGALPAVQLLVELGADVNKAGANSRRPLDVAVSALSPDCMQPERANWLEITDVLLESGASTHPVVGQRFPLASAAYGVNVDLVRLLISAGASDNEASTCQVHAGSALAPVELSQVTPIFPAVSQGHAGVVEELLKAALPAGALCHTGPGDSRALRTAVMCGHMPVVRVLLGNSFDPVTAQEALAALRVAMRKQPEQLYDVSALLQLHVVRGLQAQQRDHDGVEPAVLVVQICLPGSEL